MLASGYLLFYYKIYRDFITTLIIGVLNYTIIQNFTFSRALISQTSKGNLNYNIGIA